MTGINPNTYNRLIDTLLKCGPFESGSQLKAMFVDDRIHPWRNRLPTANNLDDRVKAVVDYLHNQKSYTGENALVLFLQVLRDQANPRTGCHRDLAELVREFERTQTSPRKPAQQNFDDVKREVKRSSISELLTILNNCTTAQDVRQITRLLDEKYPHNSKFEFDNLRGPTKWDKLNHALEILKTYDDIDAVCEAILQVRQDDQNLQKKLRKWGYDC
ncbi:hypothetical protein QUF63_12905 [Anaerolineales bacterium HSG25]|nr:hypothetical protein [Anaerolineales bacterium HSG25]